MSNAHWPQDQNDWQGRDQAQAMEDRTPRLPVVDVNSPDYWLSQARRAVRRLIDGDECVATTTGRLLFCCEELVRIARDRPTEAELHGLVADTLDDVG